MPKTYVTFGQAHRHVIAGKLFDRDTVAVIKCKDKAEGRKKAFEYFGAKFCMAYYSDDEWDHQWDERELCYYPKGYVHMNIERNGTG